MLHSAKHQESATTTKRRMCTKNLHKQTACHSPYMSCTLTDRAPKASAIFASIDAISSDETCPAGAPLGSSAAAARTERLVVKVLLEVARAAEVEGVAALQRGAQTQRRTTGAASTDALGAAPAARAGRACMLIERDVKSAALMLVRCCWRLCGCGAGVRRSR